MLLLDETPTCSYATCAGLTQIRQWSAKSLQNVTAAVHTLGCCRHASATASHHVLASAKVSPASAFSSRDRPRFKSLWVASCPLRIMRCDNCAGISAGTYAPALLSKRRNVPVTLPSNTVCRDVEVPSSRSTQLSRLTRLVTGSLGTNAEKANPGQHMLGTSLYVEAATRLPPLLLRSFALGGPKHG